MIKSALNPRHWIIWLTLLMMCVCGMGIALFAQYQYDMQPCYLCIYQRIALCVIGAGALVGLFLRTTRWRLLGTVTVLSGITIGIVSGIKLLYMQSQPLAYGTCAMGAEQMIELFGWIEALPILFTATGDCGVSSGGFLGMKFELWSLLMFVDLLLLVVASYWVKRNTD